MCSDIKNIELNDIDFGNNISLLVSNSLIHHIKYIDDFFNSDGATNLNSFALAKSPFIK